jgi:hypothetical protein
VGHLNGDKQAALEDGVRKVAKLAVSQMQCRASQINQKYVAAHGDGSISEVA